jgi:tetratricopeptide (TPR) repeat protein
MRAVLLAMLGQIEEAWAVGVAAEEQARELGIGTGDIWLSEIALIAGDQQTAAEYLRSACEEMEERGAAAHLSTYAPQLGRVLCTLGRPDEAEQLALKGRELGDPEDVWTQALWRQALALVHSAREEHAEAVRLAREGVDWFSRADSLLRQGDANSDLAYVLDGARRRPRRCTRRLTATSANRSSHSPAELVIALPCWRTRRQTARSVLEPSGRSTRASSPTDTLRQTGW